MPGVNGALIANHDLKYHFLGDFDRHMIEILKKNKVLYIQGQRSGTSITVIRFWPLNGQTCSLYLIFILSIRTLDMGFHVPPGNSESFSIPTTQPSGGNQGLMKTSHIAPFRKKIMPPIRCFSFICPPEQRLY